MTARALCQSNKDAVRMPSSDGTRLANSSFLLMTFFSSYAGRIFAPACAMAICDSPAYSWAPDPLDARTRFPANYLIPLTFVRRLLHALRSRKGISNRSNGKILQALANFECPARAVAGVHRATMPCLCFCPIALSLTSINFGLWEDYYNKTQNEKNDNPGRLSEPVSKSSVAFFSQFRIVRPLTAIQLQGKKHERNQSGQN